MMTKKNVLRGLRDPSLLLVWARCHLLYGAIYKDRECVHMIRAWSSGRLPHLSLREIFPGIQACPDVLLRKPEARTVGWSLDLNELVHVLCIAKHTNARRILEVGTYDGFSTLNLAANLNDNGEVSTVDLPPERRDHLGFDNACPPSVVGSKFHSEKEALQIRQFRTDSTSTDWSSFGAPFDMILIDGSHQYPCVKSDSRNAVNHVRPGGTVLWHDYGHFPSVSKAVDELSRNYKIAIIMGTRLACYRAPCTTT